MVKKVVILGTLDTKGEEFKFIKDIIESQGMETLVINAGVLGKPYFQPDIANTLVAEAGGTDLAQLIAANDRGKAIDVMMKGSAKIMTDLEKQGIIGAVISLGGTAGTTIGTHAMQALSVGVPKLMVSTVASGDTRPYVGNKDITMMYSVVDISGINSISSKILANAAFAVAGMAKGITPVLEQEKPLLAATMFGVTTPCVTTAREYLESKGYEVLVFHATGAGGGSMEALITAGFIKGVLDITTTEWADELVGGVFNAGPHRLEAAGKMGIPQVVSTGALDMVNFGAMDTVPEQFKGRNLYKHNATVTLMRTTVDENRQLGQIIADKLNMTTGPTALFLPLKGVSLIDAEGQPFYGAEEDRVLFDTLRANINKDKVELIEMDMNINDEIFALSMAKKLIDMLEK
ncbi:MAG: Tm-1-like ATP-binding domain-containing protein [Firmicutes bacterium]|nr:Tm-1-like ATP-binding domain-containing protein [Bacillota bacterium]